MRVGVLMQHLLTGTLLVTSVLGGLNSEGDLEQPFNRTRPCQPQSLPIETFSISATTDGNSILCAGGSMFPQRLYVRGSSSVIDLGRFTVKRGAVAMNKEGKHIASRKTIQIMVAQPGNYMIPGEDA